MSESEVHERVWLSLNVLFPMRTGGGEVLRLVDTIWANMLRGRWNWRRECAAALCFGSLDAMAEFQAVWPDGHAVTLVVDLCCHPIPLILAGSCFPRAAHFPVPTPDYGHYPTSICRVGHISTGTPVRIVRDINQNAMDKLGSAPKRSGWEYPSQSAINKFLSESNCPLDEITIISIGNPEDN